MMHRKFQNIEKLEKNERKQAQTALQTVVNNLFLNMNSEQLLVSQNLDA